MVIIQELFQKFKKNLEITDLQTNIVSKRQKNVRCVIERYIEIKDSFLTGSYVRNTMIAPLSDADIDIFFVLDPSFYFSFLNILKALPF
jgi:tRNA nucleotidyltransferase (CCA-adding enzyme)